MPLHSTACGPADNKQHGTLSMRYLHHVPSLLGASLSNCPSHQVCDHLARRHNRKDDLRTARRNDSLRVTTLRGTLLCAGRQPDAGAVDDQVLSITQASSTILHMSHLNLT